MDGYLFAFGVDIFIGIGLYLVKRNFLSNICLLNNDQSISDFYKTHVETISVLNDNGNENVIKETGCNVIMSGCLLSINNNREGNKIFNDVIMWCQSILLNKKQNNQEIITPISYNVICSPLVILKRKLWKYYLFPITETIVIDNPVQLEGLEPFYEVVLDKFMTHGDTGGYRVMDKMIFSGTRATISGWLTYKENSGQYFVSRNEQFNNGVFQISKKSLHEFNNEINANKYITNSLSVCIKLAIGLGIVFATLYVYRKLRQNRRE